MFSKQISEQKYLCYLIKVKSYLIFNVLGFLVYAKNCFASIISKSSI